MDDNQRMFDNGKRNGAFRPEEWTGKSITFRLNCSAARALLSVPYHLTYSHSDGKAVTDNDFIRFILSLHQQDKPECGTGTLLQRALISPIPIQPNRPGVIPPMVTLNGRNSTSDEVL